MAQARQYIQDSQINNGTTASSNIKMTDVMPIQHTDVASNVNQINKVNIAQTLCEPVAVCNSNNPANGAYTATCSNFPDFALSYTDSQGTSHTLIGMKVRVVFNHGITYGSVSGGTYPTLNINGSGAIPLLAQGKTMAKGAISAGQTVEFTVIPYGNGLAYDADSNVRESTSDYTIYTDGLQRVDNVTVNDKNMVTSNGVSKIIREERYTIPKNGGSKTITIQSGRTAIIYSALYNGIYILAFALGQYSTVPIINIVTYNGISCVQGTNTNEIVISTGAWVSYDISIVIKYI